MTAITRKRNVPGYVDELGRFRPIRSASYIGSKSAPRKARVADRKKYSKAKAGDLGKARQARALEDPWDRDARLEREAKAAQQRERERIERQLENEIYGETSGRTSRGKGRSLAQFVRAEGGINTKKTVRKGRTRYGDSLENFTRKGSGSTGLVTTTAGKGKSLDYMHQAAREAGYDVPDMDDLLDALDNEIRSGKKTYSTHGSMTYNPAVTEKEFAALQVETRRLASRRKNGVRLKNPIGWFRDVSPVTPEAVKKLYKTLATQYHPDKPGGDLRSMQEINQDYAKALKMAISGEGNAARADAERKAAVPLREAIEFAVTLPESVNVVIRGLWLWLEGGTFAAKDQIKAFQSSDGNRFKWASKKKAWFFAAVPSANRRGEMSFDDIDRLHGRELVNERKRRMTLKGNPAAKKNGFTNNVAGARNVWVHGYDVFEAERSGHKLRDLTIAARELISEGHKFQKRQVTGLKSLGFSNYDYIGRPAAKKNPERCLKCRKMTSEGTYWENVGYCNPCAAKLRPKKAKAKKNPDLLGMFANAAVGIASTLQINEMVKRKTRRTAPKKRGTTTAKAKKRNPAGKHYTVKGTKNGKRVQFFTQAATPAAAIREIEKYQGEIKNAKATIFTEKMAAAWFTARGNKMSVARSRPQSNPSQPNLFKRQPKGELYVLTIGSGDDLISVYLHDGDKDGFSKRFKTMAGAKSYATRKKIKLVENPKQNGIIKRAWARSRAASEYRRELRLEAAAERSRKRRQKAEQAARSNPNAQGTYRLKGLHGLLGGDSSGFNTLARAKQEAKLKAAEIGETITILRLGVPVGKVKHRVDRQGYSLGHVFVKANPRRSASGKKAVARSAKANPATWRRLKAGSRRISCSASGCSKRALWCEHNVGHYYFCGEHAARLKKTGKVKSTVRLNPKSTARRRTFEMFQGRKVTTARPMLVSNHAPANLDALGDLVELKIAGGPTLKFNGKGTKLCAAGGKLWIAGKRFAKANPAAKANELNPIGEIDHVVYGTFKPHHGDHNYTHYIHKLGEESGKRPILCVDREGFPVIRGGNYKIEARGIVD